MLGHGSEVFEFAKLLRQWTNQLTIFTHGEIDFTPEQLMKLAQHQIRIIEGKVIRVNHSQGQLQQLVVENEDRHALTALFARVPFVQHSSLPVDLGCAFTEAGYIQVDDFQQTTIGSIYAAGDNTSMLRSVSDAVAAGTKAGAVLNKELIEEDF